MSSKRGSGAAATVAGHDIAAQKRRTALHEQAHARLDHIATDHRGSDLAARLVNGDRIGPLSAAIAEAGL